MLEYNYARYKLEAYELGAFPGPKAGEMAADFTLHTMEGKEVRLADLKGKWVVLETGSYTCPMYVSNARSMNALKTKFPDVEFLVVYVREAHPGSRIGPHTGMENKTGLARKTQAASKETREFLIDDVAGTMHRAYGAFPNLSYVINPEGRVVYRPPKGLPPRTAPRTTTSPPVRQTVGLTRPSPRSWVGRKGPRSRRKRIRLADKSPLNIAPQIGPK